MKNLKAIILLFLANTVSGIAQGISMIAIPWYFSQTNDMGRFGLIYGISTLVSLVWVPYSGTLVDRFNRKHIFQAITAVSGFFTLVIALIGLQQGELPWYLIAAVFIFTFFNYNIHYPNLYAFMQEITEKKYYGKISSYLEVFGQLASAIAGAAAAILLSGIEPGNNELFGLKLDLNLSVAAWPIQKIFLMDGLTYAIAFIILSLIRFIPLTERPVENDGLLERLKTGWYWLMKHKVTLQFGIASYILFGTVMLVSFYLCASYVSLHLKEGGGIYATAEMFYSIGALVAGLSIRYIFKRSQTARSIALLSIITACFYLSLHFFESIGLLFLTLLFLGISNAGTRILRVGYLFANVPNRLYGRVNAVFFLTNLIFRSILIALFSLPFFLKAEQMSLSFVIMAIILFVTVIWLLFLSPHINKHKSL